MKKHQIIAAVGTIALAVNLLVPTLTSAEEATQTGKAIISANCNTPPSFSITPAENFSFSLEGDGTSIKTSSSDQQAFNNPNGSLSTSTGNFIAVKDERSLGYECNNGLTVTVQAEGSFASGLNNIPLDGLRVVSSAGVNCPTGYTSTDNVCVAPLATSTTPSTSVNYTGTDFAVYSNYSLSDNALGSGEIPRVDPIELFSYGFDGLNGKAGVGISYATNIPAFTPAGTYSVNLTYTLMAS